MDIRIDEKTCSKIDEALRLEWLDTNGLGGYASDTILNCHTRRYHGLLVADLSSPPGKFVLLSSLEESILSGGREIFFSLHKYPGTFSPSGYKCLSEFRSKPAPHFIYRIDRLILHKTIMTVHGKDAVLIRYSCVRSDEPSVLRLKPFLAFRDFHSLAKENPFLDGGTAEVGGGFKIRPYEGMPVLYIQTDRKSVFHPAGDWYRNFEYMVEAERGFDFREDLFRPGILEISLKEGETVIFSASTRLQRALRKIWDAEWARRENARTETAARAETFDDPQDRALMSTLMESAKDFLIRQPQKRGPGRPTVTAGYHWFGDWGRDTLISLPGLTFCTDESEIGKAILKTFGKYEKDGLLPNFFGRGGSGHAYNSVDCSLWFFWAAQQLLLYTGDIDFVRKFMWPVMVRIIRKFKAGTVHLIHMSDNGLLHAGDETMQLTWMDAAVNGVPVTPRCGWAVDINALWYNAVCLTDELAERFGRRRERCPDLKERIREAFNEAFWIEDGAYLGDVRRGDRLDRSVRPNQILAVSLPHSPLDRIRARSVVDKVAKELLTPFGLRTLSPRDPVYRGRYAGDAAGRDAAYHQGTVWPWLIGHFGEAFLKVAEDKKQAAEFLRRELRKSLREHLQAAGVGSISEIFDGDPPYHPNGCIAQSWSVAEIIRLYFLLNGK